MKERERERERERRKRGRKRAPVKMGQRAKRSPCLILAALLGFILATLLPTNVGHVHGTFPQCWEQGVRVACESGGNDEVGGRGRRRSMEESTVNEIMYARGSPRVRGARGFNFCAKILAHWERGRGEK